MSDFKLPRAHQRRPVAYVDFHPGADISATPGSEAFVGMILRDLPGVARPEPGADWIAPDKSLDDLRDLRCRSIVIVTDYIGTGNRVLKLAAALSRNRRIRSWRSFRWLDIYVVAFAASPEALERVRRSRDVRQVWIVEGAPTFASRSWAPEVNAAVIDLCRAECRIDESWALGYRDSEGLFVTERGASNNLPAVLWQTAKGWQELFRGRAVPTLFARELADYVPGPSLTELAEQVGQLRLGQNKRLRYMRASSQSLLRVLLLSRRIQDQASLSAQLGLEIADIALSLKCLKQLGLLDAAGAITARGRDEIAANKRGLRRTTAGLTGSESPYYPLSLR
jgi:hypothetical protein